MQSLGIYAASRKFAMLPQTSEAHPVSLSDLSCADSEMIYMPMTCQNDPLEDSRLEYYLSQSDVGYGSQVEAPNAIPTTSQSSFVNCGYPDYSRNLRAMGPTPYDTTDFRRHPLNITTPISSAPQYTQSASDFATPAITDACIMPNVFDVAMLDSQIDAASLWAHPQLSIVTPVPSNFQTAAGGLVSSFQHPSSSYRPIAPSICQNSSLASSLRYSVAPTPFALTPDPSTRSSTSSIRTAREMYSRLVQEHAHALSANIASHLKGGTEADRWKCPHCPFVQKSKRTADFKRHKQKHVRTRVWICCGLPHGVVGDREGAGEVFEWQGVRLVGGCGKVYGRKDTLLQHLRVMNVRGLCVGNAHAPWHSGGPVKRLTKVSK